MKINKLRIFNYKMFKEEVIELDSKYNVFVGDNDLGESSLLEAIQIITNN